MKKIIYSLSTLMPLSFVSQVHAQREPPLTLEKPTNYVIEDLGLFITRAINMALGVAAILVFVYLVWGGIQWITSGGDKAKTEEARGRITAALIGLAVVATAWAVMLLVQYFLGLNVFENSESLLNWYE